MLQETHKNLTEEKIILIINEFLEEEFEVDKSKLVPAADLKSTLELDKGANRLAATIETVLERVNHKKASDLRLRELALKKAAGE